MSGARHISRWLPLLAALAVTGACSDDKSFIRVEVISLTNEIADVRQLVVDVSNPRQAGGFVDTDTLRYPKDARPAGQALTIRPLQPVTFSVSFSTDRSGPVLVEVEALGPNAESLGYGSRMVDIDPGHTRTATVAIVPGAVRPIRMDGGVPLDGGGTPDAAMASDAGMIEARCEVTDPAGCGAGRTCTVGCKRENENVAVLQCAPAGTKQPGEVCAANECAPGSQCLQDFCGVATCQRLCRTNADCAAVSGSLCLPTPITCGTTNSDVRICSQPCNPVAPATDGCAAGLACFVFQGEIASCDCPGDTRTGDDGTACRSSTDCKPGLLCVAMQGGQAGTVCRPICKLTQPGTCPVGRSCQMLRNPDFQVWGACLPQ